MLKRSRRDGKNIWKNCIKKILMNQISRMVWSVTQSQTFWSAKSNGPLRSTAACKASGCNEIPAELFKSLEDDAIKVFILYVSKSGRSSSDHRTEKVQSSSQFPGRAVPKNVPTIGQLHSSPMLERSCLKSGSMQTKNFQMC